MDKMTRDRFIGLRVIGSRVTGYGVMDGVMDKWIIDNG